MSDFQSRQDINMGSSILRLSYDGFQVLIEVTYMLSNDIYVPMLSFFCMAMNG